MEARPGVRPGRVGVREKHLSGCCPGRRQAWSPWPQQRRGWAVGRQGLQRGHFVPTPPQAHMPHSRSLLCPPGAGGSAEPPAQCRRPSWAHGGWDAGTLSPSPGLEPLRVSLRHPSSAWPPHSQGRTKKPGWACPAPPGKSQVLLRWAEKDFHWRKPAPCTTPDLAAPAAPSPEPPLSLEGGGSKQWEPWIARSGKVGLRASRPPPGDSLILSKEQPPSPLGVGPRPPPSGYDVTVVFRPHHLA